MTRTLERRSRGVRQSEDARTSLLGARRSGGAIPVSPDTTALLITLRALSHRAYTNSTMSDDYATTLLEEMNGKFDILVESVSDINHLVKDIPVLKADMAEVKSDVKIIKAVLTDHSHQIQNHELRITNLEQPAS